MLACMPFVMTTRRTTCSWDSFLLIKCQLGRADIDHLSPGFQHFFSFAPCCVREKSSAERYYSIEEIKEACCMTGYADLVVFRLKSSVGMW
jgi:hypothetical protein